MEKTLRLLLLTISLPLLSLLFVTQASAADIRVNNTIIIQDDKTLSELYLFGNTIDVRSKVNNDIVAAGANIDLNNSVTGNVMAAGGTLKLKGQTAGSARVAGGNLLIDGLIGRDLMAAGGNVAVTKTSSIAGDLVLSGGEINLDGHVMGRAIINGGEVNLNGVFDKGVEGNIGKLSIGPDAKINGNLTYSSPERATIDPKAQISGKQNFTKIKDKDAYREHDFTGFFKALSFYKLLSDIVISIILLIFLNSFLKKILTQAKESPFGNLLSGLAFLILIPILCLFLLILVWLGIITFVIYSLIILLSVYVAKILAGWLLIKWWLQRQKITYELDWKAGLLGPIIIFTLQLIPVIGWFLSGLLYLVGLGAVVKETLVLIKSQKTKQTKKK